MNGCKSVLGRITWLYSAWWCECWLVGFQRFLIFSEMLYINILSSTSISVNCLSWLFVDCFLAVFGIEISSKKLWEEIFWFVEKKTFLIFCKFSFSTRICVELTCTETCFIHCVGSFYVLCFIHCVGSTSGWC